MDNEENGKQPEPVCEAETKRDTDESSHDKPEILEQKNASEETTESGKILTFLRENGDILRKIQQLIESRLENDATKEKAFDKLYEEMRKTKEMPDLLDRTIKPILTDLVLLYDSMKRTETKLKDDSQLSNENIVKDFEHLRSELMEVMYRQDVVPIDENPSETFNSKLQKAIKAEDTENLDENMKIKRIVRSGFLWRDKVLRPQEVVVNKYMPNTDAKNN